MRQIAGLAILFAEERETAQPALCYPIVIGTGKAYQAFGTFTAACLPGKDEKYTKLTLGISSSRVAETYANCPACQGGSFVLSSSILCRFGLTAIFPGRSGDSVCTHIRGSTLNNRILLRFQNKCPLAKPVALDKVGSQS